jgi:hypothetical protein
MNGLTEYEKATLGRNTELQDGPLRGVEKASAQRLLELAIGYLESDVEQLTTSYREADGTLKDPAIANEVRRVQRWIKRAKELAR